jgi:hypothetical protein
LVSLHNIARDPLKVALNASPEIAVGFGVAAGVEAVGFGVVAGVEAVGFGVVAGVEAAGFGFVAGVEGAGFGFVVDHPIAHLG